LVTDAVSGDKLENVEVQVLENHSEILQPRLTDSFGRYRRLIPPVFLTMKFSEEGYITQTFEIEENVDELNVALSPVTGCMESAICNFNSAAKFDDGSCLATLDGVCESCSGEQDGTGTIVDNDTDDDTVCNANEVVGCQDMAGCNYMALATDAGTCTFSTDLDACATCSGATDGTGTIVDNDTDGTCSLSNNENILPLSYKLNQNFPNPFNPSTIISFYLPSSQKVWLKIFDINGKLIHTLINNEIIFSGYHEYALQSQQIELVSGIYLYKIEATNWMEIRKMLFIK